MARKFNVLLVIQDTNTITKLAAVKTRIAPVLPKWMLEMIPANQTKLAPPVTAAETETGQLKTKFYLPAQMVFVKLRSALFPLIFPRF